MKQKQIRRSSVMFRTALLFAVVMLVAASLSAQAVKQRSEIDAKYKWKTTDMFASDADWQKQFASLKANIGSFDPFKGHLADSAATLRRFLKQRDSLYSILDNLEVYASLKLDEDRRVSTYQEMADNISSLGSRLRAGSSFAEPEILAMDNDRLMGFLKSDPGLEIYRFYLQSLVRSKQHILSDKEEAILANAGPVLGAPSNIFGMIDNADVNFGYIKDENGQEIQLSKERYTKILASPDRRMRRDAALVFDSTYFRYANSLAATMAASVKKDYFLAQTRKYNSCLESRLDGDSIPTSVFYNLIDAVNANLAPLHKWASLRKRILGIDTLYAYDQYAPLTTDKPKEYTIEEAKAIVLKGLAPMGKTYLTDFENGLNSGWVDVYETQGKRSGAYCTATYTSHPYVLLNFNGTLQWVFTLAHEMGHAMHNYYTNRTEPYLYGDHYLFTAEVASTCNEAVLMKYMLEHTTDKQEKTTLLTRYIEQIIGTFYTQMMFSEFELAIHKRVEGGEALSLDFFRKTFRDIYQKYWGPEMVIPDLRDLRGLEIPHFYREYYVYQYATCYAAAQMISQRILDNEKGALDTYMKFLRTGTSKYPVTILKDAGVDMTTPEPYQRTIKLFGDLVDQLEKLMNEK